MLLRRVFTSPTCPRHTHTHIYLDTHTLAVGCGLTHERELLSHMLSDTREGTGQHILCDRKDRVRDGQDPRQSHCPSPCPDCCQTQERWRTGLFRPHSLPTSLSSSVSLFLPPSLPYSIPASFPLSLTPSLPPSLPISLCPSRQLAFPLADREVGSVWSGGGGVGSDMRHRR